VTGGRPPTVSVCIPTYNGAEFVARTIASVLAQDFDDYEIVFGDDGSTDGTVDVLRAVTDERARIVPGVSGLGAPANFNRLIDAARGRYVKLLCQDDMLYPDCLSKQVAAMEAGESRNVVMVSCQRDIVDDQDRVVYRDRGWKHPTGIVDGGEAMRANVRAGTNVLGEPSATLCRREVLERVGGYSLDQSYMVDLDLWMRLLREGNLAFIREALCTFRVSRMSWSSQLARHQASEARRSLKAIRSEHPETVRAVDLAVGYPKPTLLSLARRAVFAFSPKLPAHQHHEDTASAAEVRERLGP
jgi:glycosyltransferase involved in cell wall biosynthesis